MQNNTVMCFFDFMIIIITEQAEKSCLLPDASAAKKILPVII